MNYLAKLKAIRHGSGKAVGLRDDIIERFLRHDRNLEIAIERAVDLYPKLEAEFGRSLQLSEADLRKLLQEGILNFYEPDTVSPYIPISAKGPWIITSHGGVVYDSGGYGMLGFGHDPDAVREAIGRPYAMANAMTPSFSQRKFVQALRSAIGTVHSSKRCPFERFVCMNSGSEAGSVAARIADTRAKVMTDPGGKHAGKKIISISLKGSFHGRTTMPARVSDSSRKRYQALASFRGLDNLITVEPNNIQDLKAAFAKAQSDNCFVELMWMEPVMGEGNPGLAVTPEFYNAVRDITRQNDTLLLIDSIQAGIRAHGVLSIVDYPGFEKCEAPDMETYSKALNGGQFPLSVLALREDIAKLYIHGTYGNTMTANPRAMEVGATIIQSMTPELMKNIREKGKEFIQKFEKLKQESKGKITKVQGCGLLVSVELEDKIPVLGQTGVETKMREAGVNVIHGGKNSLRFTPQFAIPSEEIDLIVQITKEAI